MLVIDLETKRSFDEVGGVENRHNLGISVAGVYDYQDDAFHALEEHELSVLEDMIEERGTVLGFNIKHFDYPVLQPYLSRITLEDIETIDLMEYIEEAVGFRVALNNLAKHTLGEEKSGHGLQAVEWFREGKIDEIKKYCIDDVRITKELYEYGNNHGVVRFESRTRGVQTIPAGWATGTGEVPQILSILKDAHKEKRCVEIDYVSATARNEEGPRTKRVIEIHAIRDGTVEAYCHLRDDTRHFKLHRIVSAVVKDDVLHTKPTLF